jgi:hypothetical protein
MTVRAAATLASAVLATAIAAVSVVSADGSNEPGRVKPGGVERTISARGQDGDLPNRPPIGIVSGTLARLDPLTLKPHETRLKLGEFHETWSYSPDRSRVALGMGSPGAPTCGAGICIVDLASMRVVEDIDAPIAAEAVGWVSRRQVVAVLQSGEVIVADPETGATLPGHDLSVETYGPPSAETPDGFAVVVHGDPPRLVEFDGAGGMSVADLRQVDLDRKQAGLAVDLARRRALVFAAGSPAAEVNLQTMEVRYHPVGIGAAGSGSEGEARGSQRCAVWLGRGLVAVSGSYRATRGRELPAGVKVIDTETWSARMVNRRATQAARAAGRLLVWSSAARPRDIGLRIYTRSGRRLLAHRFGDETLTVQVAGGYAYAIGSRKLRVVRVRSGRVVHRSERRGAGDALLLSSRLGSGYLCGR